MPNLPSARVAVCRLHRTILLAAFFLFACLSPLSVALAQEAPRFLLSDALTADANGDGLVNGGDVVTYTVVLDNVGGPFNIGSVVFSTGVDPSSTLVVGSVTTTRGTVVLGNEPGETGVQVDVGTIATTETVTVTFEVVVTSPVPPGVTQLSVQGKVAFEPLSFERLEKTGTSTDDPDTAAAGDATVTPVALDLAFTLPKRSVLILDANGNGLLEPGETLEYQIVATNTGDDTATGLVFTDAPDANTELVPGSVSTTVGTVTQGNGPADTSVAVSIGTLPPGGSATIVFRVNVDIPLPPGVIQVANQGSLTGPGLAALPTDDPETPAANDPTVDPVSAAQGPPAPEPIPTLDTVGIVLLGGALSGIALRRLRRRAR